MLVSSQFSRQSTLLERRRKRPIWKEEPRSFYLKPASTCHLLVSGLNGAMFPSLSLFVSGFQRRWGICSHAVHQLSCHPPTITSKRGRNMSMGGWVKNKDTRCHPPPGMGRIGQEPISGCSAWLPGRRVTICQAGWGQKSYSYWGWGHRAHGNRCSGMGSALGGGWWNSTG